jgi:nucleoid-associated protein YgaU
VARNDPAADKPTPPEGEGKRPPEVWPAAHRLRPDRRSELPGGPEEPRSDEPDAEEVDATRPIDTAEEAEPVQATDSPDRPPQADASAQADTDTLDATRPIDTVDEPGELSELGELGELGELDETDDDDDDVEGLAAEQRNDGDDRPAEPSDGAETPRSIEVAQPADEWERAHLREDALEAETPGRRRAVPIMLLWLLGALLLAAVLGLLFGMNLGSQRPTQSSQALGRPTVVIAQPKPALAPSPSPVATGSPGPVEEYVVQPGDTLRSIAQQRYGDSEAWSKIYEANRALIGPNPDALQVGMRLRIPPG